MLLAKRTRRQGSAGPPRYGEPLPAPHPARLRWVSASLRVGAASCGACVWAYWWVNFSGVSPQWALGLWLIALLLFALAFFSPWSVPRPTRVTAWAAIIVAVLMLPRSLSLSTAPYNVTLDEVVHPVCGLEMLRQHPWDIASGTSSYFGTPFLTQALQAWPCLVLAPLFGARLATVILAFASLLSTYALAARLFGAAAGLGALVVLACSYWHMAYSRMAYPYMQPMLLVPLALHVSIRGVLERHRFLQFLGGVLLGTSLLVYTPARIVIPLFLGWFLHVLIRRSLRPRQALAAVAAITLGAALAVSPYVRQHGVQGMWARYRYTSVGPAGPLYQVSTGTWTAAAERQVLANQFQTAARAYYAPGALMAVSDFSPAPLLDPVSLALCLIGAGMALLRLRDSRCFLLVLWIAATFVVAQVLTDVPASAYRAAPVLPALAISAGFALSRIVTAVRSRWPAAGRPLPGAAALLALVALILPSNLRALDRYATGGRTSPWVQMARLIGAGSPAAVYYITSSAPTATHDIFRFLADGRTMRDVPSLMDILGSDVDDKRDAVFVLDPGMAAAAAAIWRCYPAATLVTAPSPPGAKPVVGMFVPQPAVAAGRGCMPSAHGPGLWARYFTGDSWDGTVVRERAEDWPPRWTTQEDTLRFGSVEWSGSLRVPVSGEYHFHLIASGPLDSAEIGEHLLIPAEHNASAFFQAGMYSIRIRCRTMPGALCWLVWGPPGGDFDGIPPQFLMPSLDTASGALCGNAADTDVSGRMGIVQ